MNRNKSKAEEGYRRFVSEGLGRDAIWAEMKGQILLGGAAFVGGLEPKIFWSARRRKDSWRWEVIHSPVAHPVWEQRLDGAMDNFQGLFS